MQTPVNQLPLVPHYGPNNDQYYGNYAVPQQYPSTTQPTQDPRYSTSLQTQQTQATPYYYPSPNEAPPATASQVLIEIPPELRNELFANGEAAAIAAQEQALAKARASRQSHNGALVATPDNGVSADVIASQELALERIQRQSHAPHHHDTSSTSQALTVPMQVPRSLNPTGSDSVHPNKKAMKEVRKGKTAVGVVGGATIGGIAFGPAFPVGMVVGGAVGGYATNKLSKFGERRAQRKWEQQSFQHGTEVSPAVQRHGAFA